MNSPPKITVCLVLAVVISLVFLARPRRTNRRGLKLPPGPRGLPLVGNMFQVPREHIASYFRQMCKDFGGLVSLQFGSQTVILVSDPSLAHELLEKRASRFSSRPENLYYSRYINPDGIYWMFENMGPDFLNGRRLSAKAMTSVRAGKQDPLVEYETLLTLDQMLDSLMHGLRILKASVLLSAMYGTHFPTNDSPQLNALLRHNDWLNTAASPGASIINFLPWVDCVPGPMPWRTKGNNARVQDRIIYEKFEDAAEKQDVGGFETWASMFRGKAKNGTELGALLTQFTAAGIETTSTSLKCFILACVCFPNSIKAAQAQLDTVVGSDRLPCLPDRDNLPEVEAVVREVLRWRPPARAGIPHMSISDEVVEYNGKEYFIPAGSTVFGLPWAIEHDEKHYPNPDTFLPARQLDKEGNLKADYSTTTFGWGFRVCPGTAFAVRSVWMLVATMLWAFDIVPLPGHHYRTDDSMFSGAVSASPCEFPAVFRHRSHIRTNVAKKAWNECEGCVADVMAKKG